MDSPRHKLSAVGLCSVLVLSLAALAASPVHANWKVGGAELKEGTEVELDLNIRLKKKSFLFKIPKVAVTIHCEKAQIHGKIKAKKFWKSRVLVTTKCQILIGEKESPVCKLAEPIEAPTEGELFSHEGKTYFRVKPETGETLMTLKISNEECALPEEIPIKGSFVLEDPTLEEEKEEHVFTPNHKGLFSDKLTYGGNEVFLEAEMGIVLAAPNEGKAWSGTA